MTPTQVQTLADIFGYDVVISAGRGNVYMGDTFLYSVELI